MNRFLAFALFAAALLAPVAIFAQGPITSVAVYPPDVHLTGKQARQAMVVVATREDGVTLDVTKESKLTPLDANIAKVEGTTILPGAADGATMLEVDYQGRKIMCPVTVKNAAAETPVSFQKDVMAVFLRAGCNTGSCHGAARGKDGFRLSLFGFDPDGDHFRLTREIGVRRINLALPRESLLMEKSAGQVPHTGGKRFAVDDVYYLTLLKWLEAGAPLDPGPIAKVDRVELSPPNAVLEGEGAKQQFVVRAFYSDGVVRDVTNLAVFSSNNDNSAAVDPSGLATAGARGEAFVMARFDTHTVGSQVLVLPKNLQYTPPAITGNYIDELVGAKLKKIRIEPSGLCTDEEFLRRATIDITGLLPTPEEHAAFMADASPDKRAKLVDRLLERKEFSEIWAMKWATLLMIKSNNQVSYKAMFLYSNWLTDQIARNVPLNEMMCDLLSASGGTFKSPATNFYQIENDTLKVSENVAQVFMGIRTQCAQCHNHPFDRWTMNDYYGFVSFFTQIGRKQGEDEREQIIFNREGGEFNHPVKGQPVPPTFLGGGPADVAGKDRRRVMAEWLTGPTNPFFAPNVANRVWAHFFGLGIVEPVDDVRASNPPSNPELLATLGQKMVEYKYDFKRIVRDICNSQAYQRTTQRNPSNMTDERNFAHANVRRISSEQLLDCISQATETKEKFRGLPLGARAVQIADGTTSNYFLTTFGRSARNTVCEAEATTDPSLSQALHLLNGPTLQGKIAQGGAIAKLLADKKTPGEIIEQLYLRCLSRKPTEGELVRLTHVVTEAESPQAGLEDVFWAVLNSREFLFNH